MTNEAALVDAIKAKAIAMNASDIFLSAGAPPACRVHGRAIYLGTENLDSAFLGRYLLRVMNDEQKKEFTQNWELDFAMSFSDGKHRFRVNVTKQLRGISITFRVITQEIPSFDDLDLPDQLRKIPDFKSGLVLVTGSMGEGKTTTLAAIMDLINTNYEKRIITVEDPIEYIHLNKKSLIDQRDIGTHTHTFNNALRSVLRQGADVLLVGELRDLETISLALTAAETGTLVLGTLHTNGAANTVNRMIDVFPPDQQCQIREQLASSVRAVIWQRLLPRKDKKGRVAAFEILLQDIAVSSLIRDGKTTQLDSVIETKAKEGMISMSKMVRYLFEEKMISEETVKKVCPNVFNEKK